MEPGNTVRVGAMELRFIIDGGQATVFEFTVPSRARVPVPHYHESADELVYGLEGTLTTTVDGTAHELHPGDAIFIPRGAVHHHANPHEAPARALVSITPGTISRRFFEEMAELVNAPDKPDLARGAEIMRRHGLVPVT